MMGDFVKLCSDTQEFSKRMVALAEGDTIEGGGSRLTRRTGAITVDEIREAVATVHDVEPQDFRRFAIQSCSLHGLAT